MFNYPPNEIRSSRHLRWQIAYVRNAINFWNGIKMAFANEIRNLRSQWLHTANTAHTHIHTRGKKRNRNGMSCTRFTFERFGEFVANTVWRPHKCQRELSCETHIRFSDHDVFLYRMLDWVGVRFIRMKCLQIPRKVSRKAKSRCTRTTEII